MANSYIESIKHAIGFLLGQPKPEGDAIELLKADHRRVAELVEDFKDAEEQEKRSICTKIMIELTVHAKLEEELVYPLLKKEGEEESKQVDEATVEHDCVKYLIRELSGQGASDDKFDAKVIVLGELVQHHVKEEEGEMFPELRVSGIDMKELGERLAERKEELLHQIKDKPNFGDDDEKSGSKRTGHRTAATRERKSGRIKPGKRDAKSSPSKKGGTKSGAKTAGKTKAGSSKTIASSKKAASAKTNSTGTSKKAASAKTKSTAANKKAASANKKSTASSKKAASKPAQSKSAATKKAAATKKTAAKKTANSATTKKSASATKARVTKKTK